MSDAKGGLQWGTVNPEIRAMLPYTLDAIDAIYRDDRDLLPRSSLTGQFGMTGSSRRGDDGRLCGGLIDLGGCLSTLVRAAEATPNGDHWRDRVQVSGMVDTPPMDDFRMMIARLPDEDTFMLRLEAPVGSRSATEVRQGGLFGKTAWKCSATLAAWSTRGLRDEDVAHMVNFAVAQRRAGVASDDLLTEMRIERVQLAMRIKRELATAPGVADPDAPAGTGPGMGR